MANQDFTPSKEYLNDFLEYRNGELFWNKKHSRTVIVGKKVGNIDSKGYLRVCLNYQEFRLHRLIFLMHHGYCPEFIDHIDGNKINNQIENLRPATKSQNAMNTSINPRNKSGIRGVSWSKTSKKWCVQINANGKSVYRNHFDNLIDAEQAANSARKNAHNEFLKID